MKCTVQVCVCVCECVSLVTPISSLYFFQETEGARGTQSLLEEMGLA